MFDIPIPPQPVLSDSLALLWAGGFFATGILLLLWGRILSRPLMGIICAWGGVMLCGPMVRWFPSLAQNILPLKIASAAVLGTVGYLIAPIIFVILASAITVSIAWVTMLTIFARSMGSGVSLEPSAGLRQWATVMLAFYEDVNSEMIKVQAGRLLLVLLAALAIPLIIGIWRSRFMTILITAVSGAILAVGSVLTVLVKSNSAFWPDKWNDYLPLLLIAAGLVIIALIFQYVRLKASQKKKQAKEKAKKQKEQQKSQPASDEK